ncbi:MAG TPA: phage tail tape measure protein, partial [Actinomycetes bacterium]|nr:phage tail tape measure protein [Actinomycetes bacterium]
MSALADIYAAVRLKLDGSDFEAEAEKAGEQAGETAGTAMASGVVKKLRVAMLAAGGAALGAGLGIALSGAQELDTVMRQLRATTGLTADEAKRAQESLVDLFKNNLQDFSEIGEAMAKVHNDLGLTGDEAERVTELFLKFATATGQDAATAVVAFDDILDGWNLTAADAEDLMDMLIASTQKYGGTVPELQSSLGSLAPVLQGMNVTWQEGVGLLNLFNDAGIDATGMAEALGAAVLKLKPGESFNTLLAQLAAIPDQSERSRAAIELFGTTVGPKLALAIKPGRDSLDDFMIAEADFVGKTIEMADVIEDSFTNRLKMAFKQVSGVLTEFGSSLGDLVLVAALLGPKLTTGMLAAIGGVASYLGLEVALAGLWTRVASSPVVLGAASAAGWAAWLAYAAAPVALGVGVFNWIGDRIRDAWEAGTGIDLSLEWDLEKQIKGGVEKNAAATATSAAEVFHNTWTKVVKEGYSDFDWKNAVAPTEIVEEAGLWGTAAGDLLMYNWAKAIEAGRAVALAAWRSIMDDRNDVANAADQIIINNAAITAAKKVLADKKATAVEKAEARIRIRNLQAANIDLQLEAVNSGTRIEKIVKLQSMLTSKAMLKGLKSKDPQIRQYWTDLKSGIEEKLGDLGVYGEDLGRDFAHGFVQGLKSHNVAVRSQAANIIRLLNLRDREGRAAGGPVSAGVPYIVGERRAE